MIGVIAKTEDHDVVREFFELFKTPWEFYRCGKEYPVLLCVGQGHIGEATAILTLVYSGEKTQLDGDTGISIDSQQANTMLSYKGSRIPIYGNSLTFGNGEAVGLREQYTGQLAACRLRTNDRALVRVGYDLFGEIRAALTVGQPAVNAGIPVVEMHIAFLRDLIVECGTPLVEIPPVPDGYSFIACLTHDVDHPSIRLHKWDHTMFGFLYRALLGSLVNVLRGRSSMRSLLTNWAAALKLPLVHSRLVRDFWNDFDRYTTIEEGLGSTFFVIPVRGCPGQMSRGRAPKTRASRYAAFEIADHLRRLMAAGCEIGVHGIDAWRDSLKGSDELAAVTRVTGASNIGVRMHWLYFDEQSPATLEQAGFAYDSTSGYNETVGYRAGTTQVFKPLVATRLLELPMHVMDTALFYPSYLDLGPLEARNRMRDLIDNALRFGGTVTINWHDRSIAPERLWGDCYVQLLGDLRSKRPWFATASAAVAWFSKRRSAVFETVAWGSGVLRLKVSLDDDGAHLPGLRLRIHRPRSPHTSAVELAEPAGYIDIGLNRSTDTRLAI